MATKQKKESAVERMIKKAGFDNKIEILYQVEIALAGGKVTPEIRTKMRIERAVRDWEAKLEKGKPSAYDHDELVAYILEAIHQRSMEGWK